MPPDWEDSVIRCVTVGVGRIVVHNPDQAHDVAVWTGQLFRTVNDLLEIRRGCDELHTNVARQACITAWQVRVAAELLQLRHALAFITSDEVADEFYHHILSCFSIDPEGNPIAFRA